MVERKKTGLAKARKRVWHSFRSEHIISDIRSSISSTRGSSGSWTACRLRMVGLGMELVTHYTLALYATMIKSHHPRTALKNSKSVKDSKARRDLVIVTPFS